MNNDWRDQIIAFRPEWFETRYISCGEGWKDLLMQILNKTQEFGLSIKIVQIKEKFGGLRFYYHPQSADISQKENCEALQAFVHEVERISFTVCEDCGSMQDDVSVRSTRHWLRTLCRACRLKEEDRFKRKDNG